MDRGDCAAVPLPLSLSPAPQPSSGARAGCCLHRGHRRHQTQCAQGHRTACKTFSPSRHPDILAAKFIFILRLGVKSSLKGTTSRVLLANILTVPTIAAFSLRKQSAKLESTNSSQKESCHHFRKSHHVTRLRNTRLLAQTKVIIRPERLNRYVKETRLLNGLEELKNQ